MKHWNRANKIPLLLLRPTDIFLKTSIKLRSLPDGDLQVLWLISMTSISDDSYGKLRIFTHNHTFFAPDISEVSQRQVVETIDFINILETAIFNHELCTILRPLLGWLKQKSYPFVAGNFLDFSEEKRNETNETSDMTIMTTLMSRPYIF